MTTRTLVYACALVVTLASCASLGAQPPETMPAGTAVVPSAQAPVIVQSLPRIEVRRDWIDYTQLGLTIILIGTTISAGFVAYLAFANERNAVRLTQRADVLVGAIGISPSHIPAVLGTGTTITVQFKNFGPTRASDVRIDTQLLVQGVPDKHPDMPPLPALVIGPGETMSSSFATLEKLFDQDIITKVSKGDIPLYLNATVDYTDVFGKRHHAEFASVYYGASRSEFIVRDKTME